MRLIALGLLLMITNVASGSEFALRAFCPGDNPKQPSRRCLIGEMAKGTRVALLGSDSSATCAASAIDSAESLNEALGQRIAITVLDTRSCASFKFSLAHKSPNTAQSYRRLNLNRIGDGTVIRRIDTASRAKASSIETRDGEHRTVLSDALPTVYGIPEKANVYIAVFQNRLIPGDETHLLYANGSVSKIHGAARMDSAFALGNRVFVYYTFTCNLGCGYMGDFIVEITEKGFSVVFFDASGSS